VPPSFEAGGFWDRTSFGAFVDYREILREVESTA
jgi:hypothetical protein